MGSNTVRTSQCYSYRSVTIQNVCSKRDPHTATELRRDSASKPQTSGEVWATHERRGLETPALRVVAATHAAPSRRARPPRPSITPPRSDRDTWRPSSSSSLSSVVTTSRCRQRTSLAVTLTTLTAQWHDSSGVVASWADRAAGDTDDLTPVSVPTPLN